MNEKYLISLSLAIFSVAFLHASPIMVVPGGDDTMNIQSAVDSCFKAGGGEVVLAPGEYWVKGLRLRSGITLRLKGDAKLRASRNPADFDGIVAEDAIEPIKPGEFDSEDRLVKTCTNRWNNGIIRIFKASNVAVIGEAGSEIDGRNCYDPAGEEKFRGPHGISVHFSTNIVFRGYTIRDAGNWAHRFCLSSDITVEDVTILGGHDGVDFHACDRGSVHRCKIRSGDDCIAGYDNADITVKDCSLNSACSIFRIGGRNILAENLVVYGPGAYCHRVTLPQEDIKSGANPEGCGRRNTLSFFTYYGNPRSRFSSGNIVFRNCRVSGVDRFMHYNFSGNEPWQKGVGLTDVAFENVYAENVVYSLTAYAGKGTSLNICFRDCTFTFGEFVSEFIKGANVGAVSADGLKVKRVNGPFMRVWEETTPKLDMKRCTGIGPVSEKAVRPFKVKAI